jgi:hypothetical protein
MAWICAVRRKEGGKGSERLYFSDTDKRVPDAPQNQFLRELFEVKRLTGISLRSVDKAELPRLRPFATLRGVQIHYEATL